MFSNEFRVDFLATHEKVLKKLIPIGDLMYTRSHIKYGWNSGFLGIARKSRERGREGEQLKPRHRPTNYTCRLKSDDSNTAQKSREGSPTNPHFNVAGNFTH
jgi:hypothetical protein